MAKFNRKEYNKKKNARIDLNKPHAKSNSIPDLRDRLAKVEEVLAIKQETV